MAFGILYYSQLKSVNLRAQKRSSIVTDLNANGHLASVIIVLKFYKVAEGRTYTWHYANIIPKETGRKWEGTIMVVYLALEAPEYEGKPSRATGRPLPPAGMSRRVIPVLLNVGLRRIPLDSINQACTRWLNAGILLQSLLFA